MTEATNQFLGLFTFTCHTMCVCEREREVEEPKGLANVISTGKGLTVSKSPTSDFIRAACN